jgi:hypothetical protein
VENLSTYPKHNPDFLICRCGQLKCTSARYRASEKPTLICETCDRPGTETLHDLFREA